MNYILGAAMGEETKVLLTLFIMLAAAKFMAELFERLRQPAVAGEILAGVLIGPSLLNLAAPSEITSILAEIGVIFLLFNVGLETKPAAIFKVGKSAALVAVLGVVLPFVCGWLLMKAWGSTTVESLFVGTALVATSVGITARVLSAHGTARRTDSSHHSRRGSYRRYSRSTRSGSCIEHGCRRGKLPRNTHDRSIGDRIYRFNNCCGRACH